MFSVEEVKVPLCRSDTNALPAKRHQKAVLSSRKAAARCWEMGPGCARKHGQMPASEAEMPELLLQHQLR